MIRSIIKTLLIIFSLLSSSVAAGEVLKADTVWSGKVAVSDDILVPPGVTLTVMPGTTVTVSAAESTKTDPEYISPLTEITIRGKLLVKGSEKEPVTFQLEGEKKADGWAGIIIDEGTVEIDSCLISSAETALSVIDGSVRMENCTFSGNRYGMIAQGKATEIVSRNSRITGNEYGLFTFNGARLRDDNLRIGGNRKKDRYTASMKEFVPESELASPKSSGAVRRYANDVLLGETIWQGRIEINGLVRVPENSRLVVLPGTVVEFRRKDSTGAGIGENGLLIQGRIIAKGTAQLPIFFRSAEKERRAGDWDAINIMNSDGAQNLIEFCHIEDAYRGLHFHFSNVAVNRSVIRNNYRGIQFQESAVELHGNTLYRNRSGIQGRDSEIIFTGNSVGANYNGANFYRVNILAQKNTLSGNVREGMRIRDSVPRLEENVVEGNRFGILVADSVYGNYNRNVIVNNGETGMSLKNADNVDIDGNFVAGNGLNGINLQDVRAAIRGNHLAGNGDRGIGIISFDGLISGNYLAENGRYAIDLEGKMEIAAPGNWWGEGSIDTIILDGNDEPGRGKVQYASPAAQPPLFTWPVATVPGDVTWRGNIAVNKQVSVTTGNMLMILPRTRVAFAEGAGLFIKGRLIAAGKKGSEITFTSLDKKDASSWEEILLEHADGSSFQHCVIENATWGIHSHFTRLSIVDSHFTNNYGGMRFRSGPVTVAASRFDGNTIGIRSFRGNASITGNEIAGNETGIFVREKGSGLAIHGNNIFGNSNYNIRIGDFNDEDVKAEENWWGDGDPLPTIFDARQEPGIGFVRYEPYSKKRFDLQVRVK